MEAGKEHSLALAAQRCERGPVVLMVEDEVRIRTGLAGALRQAGFEVVEAVNAEEAVEVLRSGKAVDVLFTDIRMPGKCDGIELAKMVRLDFPSVKIVMTSGVRPSDLSIALNGFLMKPVHPAQLVEFVRTLVARNADRF